MKNNHDGLITSYDVTGTERVVETSGLDSYLKEIGVYLKGDLKNELCNRLQGSSNRSIWFMYFNYRQYVLSKDATKSYCMPICGVKEQPDVNRAVKYVEWITFPEQDLDGVGFNNNVFGVDYVNRKESVYKSDIELREIISSRKMKVPQRVNKSDIEDICKILYAVWFTLENDPMSRMVIIIDNPENDSMELLRQLYLLIPCWLRLQTGFMTNVTAADVKLIGVGSGLPINVMTASPSDWEVIKQHKEEYPFEVIPIFVSKLGQISFDQKKLNLLKKLAEEMDPQVSACFDCVEKIVNEQNPHIEYSFKCYGDILRKMFSEEMFWWEKRKIDSVEELRNLYNSQIDLMKNEDCRKQAFRKFYTDLYLNSHLTSQILNIVNDEQYYDREELLSFLSIEMGMKNQIEDMSEFFPKWLSEKKGMIENTDQKGSKRKKKDKRPHKSRPHYRQNKQERDKKKDDSLNSPINETEDSNERLGQTNEQNEQNLNNEEDVFDVQEQSVDDNKEKRGVWVSKRTILIAATIITILAISAIFILVTTLIDNGKLKEENDNLVFENNIYLQRQKSIAVLIDAAEIKMSHDQEETKEDKSAEDDQSDGVINSGEGEDPENKPEDTWTTDEAIEILARVNDNVLEFRDGDNPEQLLYFHIKFTDSDPKKKGAILVNKKAKYIGTNVNDNQNDENDQFAYFWQEYSFPPNDNEHKGVEGVDVSSGNKYYLHIAFAESQKGNGFRRTDINGKKYIGYYINSEEEGKGKDYRSDYEPWKEIPSKTDFEND